MNKINKWLAKLFNKRIVSNDEYSAMREGYDGMLDAIIKLGISGLTEPEVRKSIKYYSVWAKKGVVSVLTGIFNFDPENEESIKYARVCAEDLADAIRDAEQYEPIK